MATNTGRSSDPNYNPDVRLKAKGILLAIRKHGPPLPTRVFTWEVSRWFFLSQKDECSEDVPLLLELCPAPRYSFLGLFFFCFFNLAPPANEWSELERQVQISNRLQACPRAANTRGDGGRNVSQWTQEPSSQGEVALLSAGGGCEINTFSLLGVLCFSLALAPLLTHLLHWVGGPMGGK